MGTFFYSLSIVFPRFIDHAVEISLLICLIFLVKRLAPKKFPPWWHYSLWIMLLIRMLVPVEFENPLNVFNFVPTVETPLVSEFISENVQDNEIPVQPVMLEVHSVTPTIQYIVKKSLPIVWLTGAMILGICILFESLSFWLAVRRKPIVTDGAILALLAECKSRMKITKKINIVVTDNVRCPALFGYVRPRLLLPEGIFEKLDDRELSYAFMHELGHLKRHDIGVSWLIAVLQIIHWFNPLVWLAFYQIRVDQESACDAAVLARMKPRQSADYAKAIVGFLEKFCSNCQLPSLAGVLENRTQMKKRIAKIVQYRKSSQKLSLAAFVLLSSAGLILFSLTGIAAQKNTPSTSNTTAEIKPVVAPPVMIGNRTDNPEAQYETQLYATAEAPFEYIPEQKTQLPAVPEEPQGTLTEISPGADIRQAVPSRSSAIPSDGARPLHMDASLKEVRRPSAGDASSDKTQKAKVSEQLAVTEGNSPATDAADTVTAVKPVPVQARSDTTPESEKEKIENGIARNTVTPAPNAIENSTQVSVSNLPVKAEKDVQAVALNQRSAAEQTAGMPYADMYMNRGNAAAPIVKTDAENGRQNKPPIADMGGLVRESGKEVPRSGVTNTSATVAQSTAANHENGENTHVFQASNVDIPPKVIKSYPPRYPYLAKRDDITGSVTLQFTITKEGQVADMTVVESYPQGVFDETALKAIEQYRFKPGVKDGKAVDVKVNLPIKFNLT